MVEMLVQWEKMFVDSISDYPISIFFLFLLFFMFTKKAAKDLSKCHTVLLVVISFVFFAVAVPVLAYTLTILGKLSPFVLKVLDIFAALIGNVKGFILFYYSIYEEYPKNVLSIIFFGFVVYLFRRLFCKNNTARLKWECILCVLLLIALKKPFWR